MRTTHPNGVMDIFTVNGTTIMGTLEVDTSGWITLGHVGPGYGLILDSEEWPYFVKLIEEMNRSVIAESKEE